MAEEVYFQASQKIHSETIKDEMEKFVRNKKNLLKNLSRLFHVDSGDLGLTIQERIEVELEKTGMKVDKLYLRMNQKEVLGYCIKREKELLEAFKQVLEDEDIDEDVKKEIRIYKKDSEKLIEMMSDTKAAYQKAYEGFEN